MRRLLFAALAVCITTSAVAEPILTGRASVIDGDTIEIAGQRIRLDGVDAPESWQACRDSAGNSYRCGNVAANALDAFLAASRPATCAVSGHDRYKRAVAECFRDDGENVNAWLVRNGHAIDWQRYSKGRYAAEQRAAEAARAGIWGGEFTSPCLARAERNGRKPSC